MGREINVSRPVMEQGDDPEGVRLHPTERNWELGCLVVHGLSEFLATLLLLVTVLGCVALVLVPNVPPGFMRALAAGCLVGVSVALLVYSPMGKLSGAHMNPAVSFAFWLEGRLKTGEMLTYVLMQFGGAVAACVMLSYWLYDPFEKIGFAVLVPAPELSTAQLILMEGSATAILIVVLFFMMSHKELTRYTGLVLGAYLLLITAFCLSRTGSSFNPARAYGAALVAQRWQGLWSYLVAPMLGAGFGVLLCRLAPKLPRPKFHCLYQCHEHENYTRHHLERVWRKFVGH